MPKPAAFALACLVGICPPSHAAPAADPRAPAVETAARGDAHRQSAAQAGTTGDALLQLLRDKALIADTAPAAASPLVQHVRDAASDLVISAMNFIGVRYRRGGGTAEQGFDCSGFTRYVFEHSVGLLLPRRADQQARDSELLKIGRNELRPGDLVFFDTMRRAFSHVGIYIGDGRFIHAPSPGGEVRIEDMHESYWARRYSGARRAAIAAEVDDGTTSANPAAAAPRTDADRGPAAAEAANRSAPPAAVEPSAAAVIQVDAAAATH
jgi:cell wall-associated NlpC family hydrolase